MSLINKMLQDLEARQEAPSPPAAPAYRNLRPVRPARGRGAWRLAAVVVTVLVVGAGALLGAEQLGFSPGQKLVTAASSPKAAVAQAPATPAEPTRVEAAPPPPAPTVPATTNREDASVAVARPAEVAGPKAVAAPTAERVVTELNAPSAAAATPTPPNSQNRADVGIVKPEHTSPAPSHKGERKQAERNAPSQVSPPVAAVVADDVVMVDKKLRPLTADEEAEAAYRRAVRFLDQSRPDDAMHLLREALAVQPKQVKARELAAGIALQNGHWREAQSLLEEGLRQVPNHYLFARLLARVYVDHGAEGKALAVMESAAPHGSDDGEFSSLLALLYQRAGRHEDALKAYERALALKPDEGRTWLGFAISLDGAEQWGAAKNAYLRAKEVGLTPPLARYAEQRLAALKNR